MPTLSLDLSLSGWHSAFGGGGAPTTTPVITLTSGSGYSGSVLTSTIAGQWTADGANISGATGTSYTITVSTEGKDIKCGNSNTFAARWLPSQLNSIDTWFDAKYGITLNGSNVSAITARAGDLSASQSTASYQPTYNAIGLNNKPALIGGTYDSGIKMLLSRNIFNSVAATALFISDISAPYIYCAYNGTNSTQQTVNRSTIISPCIIIFVSDGTTLKLYLNGTLIATQTTTAFGNIIYAAVLSFTSGLSSQSLRVFIQSTLLNDASSPRAFNGALGAIITARGTGNNYQKLEGALAHDWGLTSVLPTNHPYKTNPPMKV